jgi:hypothetical protein
MGQTEFLTKQLDVFANVLARLFNLERRDDLEPALEFVREHVDIELLNKLKGAEASIIYNNHLLINEIEFLIYLKFSEVEIMEKIGDKTFILSEKSKECLEMIDAFLQSNPKIFYMEVEHMKGILLSIINK